MYIIKTRGVRIKELLKHVYLEIKLAAEIIKGFRFNLRELARLN